MLCSSTILCLLLVYIAQIRAQLVRLLNENQKLLNKMNEGLIVVSEKDLSLKFASKPAISVLKQLTQTETLLDNFNKGGKSTS